ncbi:hypothetical protein TNIN_2131 [Trichonephila inaurata madagascariensis]|uniref:Uncharacterized protein n=1 Tax=Trichonephila inaurata madagascariensis TaxID=2747483 RepID=A0A8X7CFZ5_9ARAC|nr:hypothetical protein TNIN_2131 [Trichonephila inaurata madagascariensis]
MPGRQELVFSSMTQRVEAANYGRVAHELSCPPKIAPFPRSPGLKTILNLVFRNGMAQKFCSKRGKLPTKFPKTLEMVILSYCCAPHWVPPKPSRTCGGKKSVV